MIIFLIFKCIGELAPALRSEIKKGKRTVRFDKRMAREGS